MFIERDISYQLRQASAWIQILLGPRQCGKSTLFASLLRDFSEGDASMCFQEITFDDLQMRQLANRDPALFLQQFPPPLLLDEVQYVPNLFAELKKIIDAQKRQMLFQHQSAEIKILFRLTGSNQILLNKNVKESLAGRASYDYLNTLSVHEILRALPETAIRDILFKGGWPELYTHPQLSVVHYLNDYLQTYVEKDIVLSAGIEKLSLFHTLLQLLGARTGQEVKYTELSNNIGGVSSVTVKEWIGLLAKADLVYLLQPYFSNLVSRLTKTPKLYFLDMGLAVRLQGWVDVNQLMRSPYIGALFESLVFAEIIKFMRNYRKNWQLFFWRTKTGEEIDFIIQTERGDIYALDAKLASQGIVAPMPYPPSFRQHFSPTKPLVVVTYGGQAFNLSAECRVVPIAQLHDYLLEI